MNIFVEAYCSQGTDDNGEVNMKVEVIHIHDVVNHQITSKIYMRQNSYEEESGTKL